MKTRRSSRLGALLLAVLVCVACTAPEPPVARVDAVAGPALARDAAAILLRLSAYDYAVVGGLNNEVERVVTPQRYATVAAEVVRSINDLTSRTVAATADRAGPVRDALLTVADEMTVLGRGLSALTGGGEPAALDRVFVQVATCWQRLQALASALPADPDLARTIERGTSFTASATPQPVYALTIGPYASKAEADAAAANAGRVEGVSPAAPFVVRVRTFGTRAEAEAGAAALVPRGFNTTAIVEEQRYTFARGGTAPDVELWREPSRIFDTHGAARRVAISPGGEWLATGSDDGTVAIFSGQGVLRALPRFNAGVAHLVFSDDGGAWLLAGGLTLATLRVPLGSANGVTTRLPRPAAQAVFVPGARAFVASSEGPTGQQAGGPGVIGARAPDGTELGAPFPLSTPAAGSVLATSDLGELFIATPAAGGGATDIEVLRLGAERRPRGIVRIPGTVRTLTVERGGTRAAAITETGLYRFGPKDADPTGTLSLVAAAPRDAAFGPDGTLFVLEQTRLSLYDASMRLQFTVPLTDGRRLLPGTRAVVLDGTERIVAVDPRTGLADELGTGGGTVQDLALSMDGKRVAVLVDGRRAVLFTLP